MPMGACNGVVGEKISRRFSGVDVTCIESFHGGTTFKIRRIGYSGDVSITGVYVHVSLN
jgi:hypothetical protein